MHRGIATFTLDYGKCPKWLFDRMVSLGREITRVLIEEYGSDEYVKRLADPVWFQSLGTVLAFDWNASGLTTILTAALKEAIRGREKQLGVFICGGKGKTSRKTPDEIMRWGEQLALPEAKTKNLVYNSKMSAKVDNSLIQDNYQIYHHTFIFSLRRNLGKVNVGSWAVIQQGMDIETQTARRYHWFSEDINDLITEPHKGIVSQKVNNFTLNMTSKKSLGNRKISLELVQSGYKQVMKDIQILKKHSSSLSKMISFVSIDRLTNQREKITLLDLANREFKFHKVLMEDFSKSKYLEKILFKVVQERPENYEKLLAIEGVGPKTIRALSLVSEVIYGAKASYEDPARYSFAHGGKDATPYPVDRETYDDTINILRSVISKTKLSVSEKDRILRRIK